MNDTSLFLFILAAISLAFAAGNGYSALLKRSRTSLTEGTVCSIALTRPKWSFSQNCKWAKVSYKINGRKYVSPNQIKVPQDAQIGTKIMVRYDEAFPARLYHFSIFKIFIALFIAVVCLILGTFYLV